MTIVEAMDIRRSRRKYSKTPISKENVLKIQQLIERYNQEAGLHFQLILNDGEAFKGFKKSYELLTSVEHYLALVGSQKDPHIQEKTGCYGELLVLEATAMGLGTCWIGGAYDKGSCVCDVGKEEDFICVIPLDILRASVKHDEKRKEVLEKQNKLNLIELGIAKLHFELGAGKGSWQFGDGGKFTCHE